jgi:hypothetical protein
MVPLLVKRLTITASTLRARRVRKRVVARRPSDKRVAAWSRAPSNRSFATFPLRAAADAHRLLESSQHREDRWSRRDPVASDTAEVADATMLVAFGARLPADLDRAALR